MMASVFIRAFRTAGLLSVLLLSQTPVFANIGNLYLVRAHVKLKDGSLKHGYFTLFTDMSPLLERDNSGYSYCSYLNLPPGEHKPVSMPYGIRLSEADDPLRRLVHDRMPDSVYFFADACLIETSIYGGPEGVPSAVMLGKPLKFTKQEFKHSALESIQEIVINRTETRLTLQDRSWIKPRPVLQEDVGHYDICLITAVGFQQPSPSARALLNELKALCAQFLHWSGTPENYTKLQSKEAAIIEKLRQEQIIVIFSCSC
jgi:hypothetical protein